MDHKIFLDFHDVWIFMPEIKLICEFRSSWNKTYIDCFQISLTRSFCSSQIQSCNYLKKIFANQVWYFQNDRDFKSSNFLLPSFKVRVRSLPETIPDVCFVFSFVNKTALSSLHLLKVRSVNTLTLVSPAHAQFASCWLQF